MNRTPPLVIAWSNPKKVKLSPEGVVVAAGLYLDAIERGKLQAIAGVYVYLDGWLTCDTLLQWPCRAFWVPWME